MQLNKFTIIVACALGLATVPILSQATDQCDYIYGVHDGGLNDSQLLRYSEQSGLELLGQSLKKYDIEALDISRDRKLYGASGDNTEKKGYLYTFDMDNGDILSENPIKGCNELDGISFNPSDSSLWGWDQDQGLVKITNNTCTTVFPNENGFEVEDLSWDNVGKTIYFAYNDHHSANPDDNHDSKALHHIGKYSLTDGSVEWQICDIQYPEIEALEMLKDNTLLVGYHDRSQQWTTQIDLQTCETTISGKEITSIYNDVEGLAVCLYRNTQLHFLLRGTLRLRRTECSGEQKLTQDNLYMTFNGDNTVTTQMNGTVITKRVSVGKQHYYTWRTYWPGYYGPQLWSGEWHWDTTIRVGGEVYLRVRGSTEAFHGSKSQIMKVLKERRLANVDYWGTGDNCHWEVTRVNW